MSVHIRAMYALYLSWNDVRSSRFDGYVVAWAQLGGLSLLRYLFRTQFLIFFPKIEHASKVQNNKKLSQTTFKMRFVFLLRSSFIATDEVTSVWFGLQHVEKILL